MEKLNNLDEILDQLVEFSGKLFEVKIDQKLIRPQDIDNLIGDSTKAKKELEWKPTVQYTDLIRLMVDDDLTLIEK